MTAMKIEESVLFQVLVISIFSPLLLKFVSTFIYLALVQLLNNGF